MSDMLINKPLKAPEKRRTEQRGMDEMDGCSDGGRDRAQYRPIMEGLDRPAARGRDWELLIGGE